MNSHEPTTPEGLPRWSPGSAALDELECLLLGAYGPSRHWGSPTGLAVPLSAPHGVTAAARTAGALELLEEEGTPVATLVLDTTADDEAGPALVGELVPLRPLRRGLLADRYVPAEEHRAAQPAGRVHLGVPVEAPPLRPQLEAVLAVARRLGAKTTVLPLTGEGRARLVDGPALVRAWDAVNDVLDATVVPVPVPAVAQRLPGRGVQDGVRACAVARAYGATVVLDAFSGGESALGVEPVVDLVQQHVAAAERGVPLPEGLTPSGTRQELRRLSRADGGRGFTVFFTGLSGSGKSTIARGLEQHLLSSTARSVTLLDGDIVRRMLSSGLTFSREDRDLNVRRIGFVAAEITRHGGIAVCAPVAPYEAARAEVRAMVEPFGGFLLVHVSTSLDVCEARDRKGLYARARAGELTDFTGVSDPYQVPRDADLTIDTERTGVIQAVDRVVEALSTRGWVADEPSP